MQRPGTAHLAPSALALSLGLALASSAAERPPQMDSRFQDLDGDLVADPPADPSQWIDPQTLIFAYTPLEDPAVYETAWTELWEHVSGTTGKRVKYFATQSNAAQLEAMRAGRIHIAGFNTGSVPTAVNLCGYVPFCSMAAADGSYGYQMEILVPAASPIRRVSDLRGKKIAFTTPTSNSGFKAPTVILRREFGLEPERDYTPVFSGKHDNSILGVAAGDYQAVCIANEVLHSMLARGAVDPAEIRSIYRSRTFPSGAWGTAYNLKPELAHKIRQAFLEFPWAGSGLEKEFKLAGLSRFIPITYLEHFAVVREIDEALGVKYAME
jgi:phosphonate transport system substrate-binding protein